MEPASPVLRRHPDGVLVAVWVVPGGVAGRQSPGSTMGRSACAWPLRPKAGRPIGPPRLLVARAFGARGGEVVSGHAARRKDVLLAGVTLQAAEERLAVLLADR